LTKKSHLKGGFLIFGCALCTVIELLQQHRKEVISIKDQLRFMKERLAT
jgi:hypothetical protein